METPKKNFMVYDAFIIGCKATASVLGTKLDNNDMQEIMTLLMRVGAGDETFVNSPAEGDPSFPLSDQLREKLEAAGDDVKFAWQTPEAFARERATEHATIDAIVRSMQGAPQKDD
jgi:hypothetical protein